MRETRFKIQWPNPDTLFLYYLLHIRKREAAFFLNYVEKSIAYGFGNLFKNLFKWRNTTNVLVTGNWLDSYQVFTHLLSQRSMKRKIYAR